MDFLGAESNPGSGEMGWATWQLDTIVHQISEKGELRILDAVWYLYVVALQAVVE